MNKKKKTQPIISNKDYTRIAKITTYYLKGRNCPTIFKNKFPLFAAGGSGTKIAIFANSLEHMGYLCGHIKNIYCLSFLSGTQFASGSWDKSIKIWDIKKRVTISTLSEHRDTVTALCPITEGVFVSGSRDQNMLVWDYMLSSSPRHILKGHKTRIQGIVRISNQYVISGEWRGEVMVWDVYKGICVKTLPSYGFLWQMKKFGGGGDSEFAVAACMTERIIIWDRYRTWETPKMELLVEFNESGFSVEFLSRDVLLRGDTNGKLHILDSRQTGNPLYPNIFLHWNNIKEILTIAKNIIVTGSVDCSLKVLDPILRKYYFHFRTKDKETVTALVKFF